MTLDVNVVQYLQHGFTTIKEKNITHDKDASEIKKQHIVQKVQAVLDARALFPESSLADLYDPDTMPPALVKTHAALDSAVDKLYRTGSSGMQGSLRNAAFTDDAERTALLFELYLQKTEGLLAGKKRRRR